MDLKLNTLQYLTEPTLLEKLNGDNKKSQQKDDIGFYRKRIFLTTKLLLKNHKINSSVNSAFNNYARVLIQHFKIVDTNDILQAEFKNMQDKEEKNDILKSVSEIEDEANSYIITEEKDKNEGTLNNFIKTIHTKPEEKIIMPKQRIINLKSPELRNKGINKKSKNNKK